MQVACAKAYTPGLAPTRNHDTSKSQILGSCSGAELGRDYVQQGPRIADVWPEAQIIVWPRFTDRMAEFGDNSLPYVI